MADHVTPIFLLSLPRSGSTLAQRILGAHGQIATCPEPWLLLPLLGPLDQRSDGRDGRWARDYLEWIGKDRLATMGYDLADLREQLDTASGNWGKLPSDLGRVWHHGWPRPLHEH